MITIGTWRHLGTCSVASVAAPAPATVRPADVAPGGRAYPRAVTSLRGLLDRARDRLAKVGADPADDHEARLRKALLVLIALLILPISFLWAGLYLAFGAWSGSVALLYAAIS
ncbi:MAG: hypothetical protein ACRECF_12800, partial [Methyloceanibacter sp.]